MLLWKLANMITLVVLFLRRLSYQPIFIGAVPLLWSFIHFSFPTAGMKNSSYNRTISTLLQGTVRPPFPYEPSGNTPQPQKNHRCAGQSVRWLLYTFILADDTLTHGVTLKNPCKVDRNQFFWKEGYLLHPTSMQTNHPLLRIDELFLLGKSTRVPRFFKNYLVLTLNLKGPTIAVPKHNTFHCPSNVCLNTTHSSAEAQ